MSVLLTSIEVTQTGVPARKLTVILRDGMRKMAQEHRLVTLGKHFKKNPETAPGGGYGYVPRSAKYLDRKLKRFGTDDPWVRTGKAKRSARNNSVVTATQYRSQLSIKMYFPLKDQARAELEAMTSQEVSEAQQLGRGYVATEMAKPENQLKRKSRLT